MKESLNKFNEWVNPKEWVVSIPISKIIYYYDKYINSKKKKDYEWIYDTQFDECGCMPLSGAISDPYCQHYNMLIRIEK
jgi:hypothetical protein